jgi:hypothetical protein
MTTVSELVEVAAAATEESLPTIRMMARRLIDDEVLPKAIGSRIPQATTEHAALLLFAVMAAPLVKDATRTALVYGGLTYNGYSAADTTTALQGVSKLLREIPQHVNALDWSLEVCTNCLRVVVWQSTGDRMIDSLYIEPGQNWMYPPFKPLKRIASMSGECLYTIGRALTADTKRSNDGGYSY